MLDSAMAAAHGGDHNDLRFTLIAAVWQCVPVTDLARLRGQVAAAFPNTLSVGALKQADEQNLPALLAFNDALAQANVSADQCSDWGLVAAPRMPGRKRIAESLVKFRNQGAWSTSPHIIPNCSLHSASGLFSQALKLHGPNVGAGGMRGSEGEALWAALAMLAGDQLPGVWVIFTGWERETLGPEEARCQVAVLGLRSRVLAPHLPQLSMSIGMLARSVPEFSLESLGESLRGQRDQCWNIGGAVCDLSFRAAALEAAA